MHREPLRLCGALVAWLAWLIGCGGSVVDGSSVEAAKASIEQIKLELDPDDRLRFEAAVRLIVADALGASLGGGFGGTGRDGAVDARVVEALRGRTAAELISRAETIRASRAAREKTLERRQAARERARAQAEISRLRARQARALQSREALARFRVLRARLLFQPTRFGQEPLLEVKVHNGTGLRVSTAHFHAALDGGDRPAHRVRDQVSHAIPGGLGPGETAVWKLRPARSGRWRQLPAQPGRVLRMRAHRLDGTDGQPLFATDWSPRHEARLAALVSRYGD